MPCNMSKLFSRDAAHLIIFHFQPQHSIRNSQDVQHGLFPEDDPSGPAFETSSHFRPARELGGDLYDFYDIGEQVLGVAVGDVAGKGVPAALYAAFASGTVRARAFERHLPADLLYRANRTLRRRGPSRRTSTPRWSRTGMR